MRSGQSFETPNRSGHNGQSLAARRKDLERIESALLGAAATLRRVQSAASSPSFKKNGDPVTEADFAVNRLLLEMLPEEGEGWLSEETADDPARLGRRRVWIVDPLDGTKEFVAGIAEWAVSIGLVEDGLAVAGGVCNPSTGETVIGSVETGILVRAPRELASARPQNGRPTVLASRSEVGRGEWDWLQDAPLCIRPVGSVAYKLAMVAAGFAEATWTLVPKHEWDIAAGVALVRASRGVVTTLSGETPQFNRPNPRVDGLIALSAHGQDEYGELIGKWVSKGLTPSGKHGGKQFLNPNR